MSNILFAAGDIGGARALVPVITLAATRGHTSAVVSHGPIRQEGDPNWRWLNVSEVDFSAPLKAMVFASSVHDVTALSLARRAQAAGALVIHILDGWSMYLDRLQTDGAPPLRPNVYCVPDLVAAKDAENAGIPPEIILITGQPAFGNLETRSINSNITGRTRLLFVSEPVEHDHGQQRGYTESQVIQQVCSALQPFADHFEISVLPHPRDDVAKIERLWNESKARLVGNVLPRNGLTSLTAYDAVAGMASVILYRAWLLGLPVLSCQPELRIESLRQIGRRSGVVLIETKSSLSARIQEWAGALQPALNLTPRPEAAIHANAAATILRIIEDRVWGLR